MVRKYIKKLVPKKAWFDANGDGDVNHRDVLAAAQKSIEAIIRRKSVFDVNGDGVVDINDALDAARITGATIASAGVTLGAGAVAGSIMVSGKATAIATLIASSVGAAAGAGFGMVLGSTATTAYSAVQLANGTWILGVKTLIATSPSFVTTISSAGSVIAGASSGVVNTIAGLPVVQAAGLKSLVQSNSIIVIAGIPIAREVALATGLVAIVVSGGYAYYVLTRNRIEPEAVEAAIAEGESLA